MQPSPTSVTLRDVAGRAGVSINTVSRILNRRNKEVWGSTSRRAVEVRRLAEEMGYRPNSGARVTRTGRFGTICLMAMPPSHGLFIPPALLGSIVMAAEEHGLHVALGRLPDDRLSDEGFVPRMLREFACDGFLIDDTVRIPPRAMALIRRHRLPFVWLNAKQRSNCVHPDDFGMACAATERLLACGHRRVAYANYGTGWSETPQHYSAIDRYAGYAAAMAAARLVPQRLEAEHDLPHGEYVAHSLKVLSGHDRPTAVLCYGDMIARSLIVAAERERIRVPRDLSVAVLADRPSCDMGIGIATMVIPESEMGREAVSRLVALIESPGKSQAAVALPGTWVPGETVGPPKGRRSAE